MPAPFVKFTGMVSSIGKRNFGIYSPVLQKSSDPIQQLFLDKIKEFRSKASGGKLVDPSPEMQKELKNDRERVYRQHNIKEGDDLTKFPSLSFTDPSLEKPKIF